VTGLRIFAGLFAVLAKNSMQYLRAICAGAKLPVHPAVARSFTSGIWLQHELRLSSELELFANSKLSWDSSVRREDRVTGISRPTATICSNMWL
jgi:hypothetical protein